ncbi:MAG: phospholipase [Anaerolineae bacterium]|jgi:predicted esterase|nr:phospholipase [Anaerolineae bacterium]
MNPHLLTPVVHAGAPLDPANPVIVALHGRTQDPAFILGVVERLNWPAASVVAPAAADNTWYPLGFMQPIESNEPYLSYALERVETLLADLAQRGIPAERTVLLGFSQGACLAAEYAIRHSQRYGGLIIFTGGAVGPDGTQWPVTGDFAGTPAVLTCGDADAWVPADRVSATNRLFADRGATTTEKIFLGREHIVSDEEIQMARSALAHLGGLS